MLDDAIAKGRSLRTSVCLSIRHTRDPRLG